MVVHRSTVSFSEENWKKLQREGNKSKFVNRALKYFFALEEYLEKKEMEFIEKEWQHYLDTGESYDMDETFG